jgi:hypothetical protein
LVVVATPTSRISAPLVAALEATWSAIATRHPEVPVAVVVVASGTDGKASRARWGHFAALRWVQGNTQLPEVLIAGEGLARGAEEVLTTLLHEAAHGLGDVRAINDTSRQGRYHNRRYKALAEELGLQVASPGAFGWASTSLTDGARHEYRRELTRLGSALTLFRRAERPAGAKPASTNLLPCVCDCGRKIRVARSTLEVGDILCGVCGGTFTAESPVGGA